MTSAFGVRHRNHGDRRIRLREFVIIDQGDDGNKVADVCANLLSFAAKMYGHSELCDASTVSWLIDPAVVKKSLMVHIDVETKGEFPRGMTVCDWRKYMGEAPKEDLSHEKQVDADGKEPNVEMAMEFDKNRFWELLVETLKEYGK